MEKINKNKKENIVLLSTNANVALVEKGECGAKSKVNEGFENGPAKVLVCREVKKKIDDAIMGFVIASVLFFSRREQIIQLGELDSGVAIKSLSSKYSGEIYEAFIIVVGQIVNGVHSKIQFNLEAITFSIQNERDYFSLRVLDLFLRTFSFDLEGTANRWLTVDLLMDINKRIEELMARLIRDSMKKSSYMCEVHLFANTVTYYKSVVKRLVKAKLIKEGDFKV